MLVLSQLSPGIPVLNSDRSSCRRLACGLRYRDCTRGRFPYPLRMGGTARDEVRLLAVPRLWALVPGKE
eukprot:3221374-Rhodomonas_salina.1